MTVERHHVFAAARAALSRLPFVVLLVLAVVALTTAIMLACRYERQRRASTGASTPERAAVAYGDELPATGRFTKDITYTCIDAPGREVTTPVTWDDSWFFGSTYTYQHELARASSVLAALAYAESSHYQEEYQTPPYMEQALEQLGFNEVSTDSYAYRSEVIDQVLNLVTQQEDTVAYTLARKRVTGEDGVMRSVILVSIRGSYGSEWLSNLKVEAAEQGASESQTARNEEDEVVAQDGAGQAEDAAHAARGGDGAGQTATNVSKDGAEQEDSSSQDHTALPRYDHAGYVEAAAEVGEAIAPWIADSHKRGDAVTLLLVGHSRGGAIANLLAATADDELASSVAQQQPGANKQDAEQAAAGTLGLTSGDAVAGYTFAAPACTTTAHPAAARYRNIFNIANPADLMPSLPLAAWGYARYGVDVDLPAVDDAAFNAQFARMEAQYAELTGGDDPYDPEAAHAVRSVLGEVAGQIHTVDELKTPVGVATVLHACARHIDPLRILCGHYPSVYISWMYALDADELQLAGQSE